MARLEKRLILNEWLFGQFGYSDTQNGMRKLSRALKETQTGWDEQNVFYFRRQLELSLPSHRAVSNDLLTEYDQNIYRHWAQIVRKRKTVEHRDIFPLYFQYLSLLFSEHYLDRWTRDKQQRQTTLLDDLNAFAETFNQRFAGRAAAGDRIEPFTEADLSRLAFWIATGGGKTLIMHCNIRQLDYYIKQRKLDRYFNKYILITPNEGLTDQHLDEFDLSGIPAERYERDRGTLLSKTIVEVIEITKLKEKTGVTTVSVEEFGRNNVVMVDEGHRGSGGDEWFSKRRQLCEQGFSFEYSATFGQSVNALSGAKQKEMGQFYAKSVIFDYSYKFFFGDGYGKDFHILNYRQEEGGAIDEQHKIYLTACLLRFYQQCKLYKDRNGHYASYLVDDPLMVFVGGSVTGQRQQTHDTDVITALKFFADFIADERQSVQMLDLLIRHRDDLHDQDGLVFRNAFQYVTGLFPATDADSAARLFQDILDVVFNTSGRGLLHAVHLKGSGSEIGLRVGDGGEYFGVINVGEPKKLWDLLEERHGETIVCSEQEFSISLFDQIKAPDSKIRLLVGAKKFIEGWNCWRVSCMGLVNIGRNEGSQIIQLFGRGVRLKGLDFCLKRSGHLPDVEHPQYIAELETLNVFGIRADYMQAFNEYIEEEDVDSEKKTEIIVLPTLENLARTDLKVILPKKEMPDFKKEVKPVLNRDDRIRTKVSADWYGRLDSRTTRFDLHSADEQHFNESPLKPENRLFLDYDKLYFDLLNFKKQNAMYNLEISKEAIQQLLSQDDWYVLCIPNHLLEFSHFGKVNIWQEIAGDLLQKYCRKFYNFRKDEFEAPYQEYRTIQQILEDPDQRHNKQFLQNLRVEYRAAIEKSQEQLIQDLNVVSEQLKQGNLQEYNWGRDEFVVFNFDRHLYQPLIHVADGTVGISVKPAHLNKHEKKFIDDLKTWCQANADGFLDGKELYVLRNQSRGKGISFFEEGNFYPDFIVWLLDNETQYITFIDPHGLRHARSFDDSKIRFSQTIKQIEQERLRDDTVVLNSFILSPTRYGEISHWVGGADMQIFHEHNVLFMYDDEDYVSMLFGKVHV